ncbi:MAG: NAD(P)-dependent oxidoreductase [Planctomycetota bacterium]|nr:NAD(P)-dependent oxidoreductase [Planctomycetota bacterium]
MGTTSVLITGAAGFLGSRITVELAKTYAVTALDLREPDAALVSAAPGVRWERADIAEPEAVRAAFARHAQALGAPACVLHLAAFWHFGGGAERAGVCVRLTSGLVHHGGTETRRYGLITSSRMGQHAVKLRDLRASAVNLNSMFSVSPCLRGELEPPLGKRAEGL